MALAEGLWFLGMLLASLALLRIVEAYAAHSGHTTLASGVGWFIGV